MKSYNVGKLKAHLSSILAEVVSGQEVIVTDHNKPVAKLVPLRRVPPLPQVSKDQINVLLKRPPYKLKKGALSNVELVRELREEDEE